MAFYFDFLSLILCHTVWITLSRGQHFSGIVHWMQLNGLWAISVVHWANAVRKNWTGSKWHFQDGLTADMSCIKRLKHATNVRIYLFMSRESKTSERRSDKPDLSLISEKEWGVSNWRGTHLELQPVRTSQGSWKPRGLQREAHFNGLNKLYFLWLDNRNLRRLGGSSRSNA